MTMSDGTAIDWDALLKWYLSADQLIHSLDACCIIVEAMPDGDAPANLAAAEMLSGVTREAELWLLAALLR